MKAPGAVTTFSKIGLIALKRATLPRLKAGPAKLNKPMKVDTAPEGEDIARENWSKHEQESPPHALTGIPALCHVRFKPQDFAEGEDRLESTRNNELTPKPLLLALVFNLAGEAPRILSLGLKRNVVAVSSFFRIAQMNLDLFAEAELASPAEYREAMQGWLAQAGQVGKLHRESSADVYDHMWSALTAWAIGRDIALRDLTASDLDAYLHSRGGSEELSARYSWRLLRLVDRVLAHHAQVYELAPNRAAAELIASRPDIRFANSPDAEPLPDFLAASEAKLLVTYLSAVRPRKAASGRPWQEVRNRASVGLMLGAGLTPGEVRALELPEVVADGGTTKSVPWKLRVAGNGNSPARETPVAAWAGQLLRYWLDVRTEQGIPGPMVFPSTKGTGKTWGKVAQYNAAREVLQAAGIDDVEGGSFRLRHTFALRQLRRGKAAEEVGRWLGVSDPAVMSRYQRVISSPVDVI